MLPFISSIIEAHSRASDLGIQCTDGAWIAKTYEQCETEIIFRFARKAIMLSIIIPAHNAAATIEKTIYSIIENEPKAEIIVVENGSTDKTTEIVERIDYDKLRMMHSKKGVCVARNTGIAVATGEWISFVDADDYWLGLNDLKLEADITFFNYFKDDKLIELNYRGEPIIQWALSRPTLRMTVWAKVFKRSFILENSIQFDERLWVGEDSEFLLRALQRSNFVKVENIGVYRYCCDTPSVMRSYNEKRTQAYIQSLEAVREDLIPIDEDTQDAFHYYVYAHINLIGVHDIYNSSIKEKWSVRNSKARSLIQEKVIKDAIKKLKITKTLNMQRLPSMFFKLHAYSLGGLMCYLRSLHNENHA